MDGTPPPTNMRWFKAAEGRWLVQPAGSAVAYPMTASALALLAEAPLLIDRATCFDAAAAPVDLMTAGAARELCAPVPGPRPPVLYAIGANYKEHIREAGLETPSLPLVIGKAATSVTGPRSPIVIPRSCLARPEVDFEVELAIVIGKPARNVSEADALAHVLGYTVANDVSARRWQDKRKGGGQWTRAKSFDTFCPLGPCVLLAHAALDPGQLALSSALRKRGADGFATMQAARTSDMLFGVQRLVSFLSEATTLPPWTVILTGTPAGVGFTRVPPVFLEPGDDIEARVEGIGALRNAVTGE